MSTRIAVIGAGISGLTTAYQLSTMGVETHVFEASDRIGGPIATHTVDGYQLETGPHTLLVRHAAVADLLQELGIDDRAITADEAANKRFIVRDGRPRALPMSPTDFATTDVLSPAGRLRLLAEPVIPANGPDDDIDETLESFVDRRLGEEARAYLLDPFVGGIYAGNPQQLSAKHAFPSLVALEKRHGSIALGAIKERLFGSTDDRVERRLVSFEDGLATLVDALADNLNHLHLNTRLSAVAHDGQRWAITLDTPDGLYLEAFDALVITIPAYALDTIDVTDAPIDHQLLQELGTLPYAPCTVVSTGFDRRQIDHPLDGFGVLVPTVERRHILGTLFVSTMFPGRSPQGCANLTTFVGGARQPHLATGDDDQILQLVRQDLRRLLGITGDPDMVHITRWQRAIPQYEVGHQYYLDRIQALEDTHQGLFFGGNYCDGISVPDLIVQGRSRARHIDAFLNY